MCSYLIVIGYLLQKGIGLYTKLSNINKCTNNTREERVVNGHYNQYCINQHIIALRTVSGSSGQMGWHTIYFLALICR